MLDLPLRPFKDRVLRPPARLLAGRVSPNAITLLALSAGAACAFLLARGAYAAGLVAWLLSRVLDGLDGLVARETGRVTDLGGYLDLLLDMVVYAAVPVALAVGRPHESGLLLALALLLGSFYLNLGSWLYLSALLEKRGTGARARGETTSVTMPPGLIEGTETILFYSIFMLLPDALEPLFLVMAAAVGVTAVQRLGWAVRALALVPLLLVGVGAPTARAQQVAGVAGTVRAQSGVAVPGVTVVARPADRVATTDGSGRFALEVPAGEPLELRFSREGFLDERVGLTPVAPGEVRAVAVTLAGVYTLDALTVVTVRERPLLNTRDATTGGVLERRELGALPTDARDPLSLAYTIPGVAPAVGYFGDAPPLSIAGGNSLYTQYTLDALDNVEGFLGGPRVELPLSALSRLEVLAGGFGAELGRTPTGVVEMQSRGGSSRWAGEAFVYGRPGMPLDASPKYAPAGVDPEGFGRLQLGGAAGGPIVPDRMFVFAAAEFTAEREDRIGSTARTRFLGTERRDTWKLFARVDHGWSAAQTTTARFALSDVTRAGQGGGVIVPEADITTKRVGSLASIAHRSALAGGNAANTATLQAGTYRWDFPPTRSDLETPQVTIVAPDSLTVQAVVGSSNFVFDEGEFQLQLRDVLEARVGAGHTLRIGAEVVTSGFELFASSTNPSGAYIVIDDGNIVPSGEFVSIRDVPGDVRVLRYSIDARPQQVDLTQTLWGAFVEDAWRLSPSLALNLGVRWDYDDITSRGESDPDLDNFQPRGSFNWYAGPRTVLRGGAGLYTGRLPYAVYSDAVQFGPEGDAVVTLEGETFPPPEFGQGPTPAELAPLADDFPPREIRRTFARGIEQPESFQGVLGMQRELGDHWGISVDGVWVESRNLPRSWDLNAIQRPLSAADTVDRPESFGDAYRPVRPETGSFRRLTTTDTGGRARYLALQTHLRGRPRASLLLDAAWVWSRARNDTEDINFNAVQGNDFEAEWADAVNDRRHQLSLRGLYELGAARLGGVMEYQTGMPMNRIANFRDLDGSGPIYGEGFVGNYDRFPGVARNAERLPDAFLVHANAAIAVPLGGGAVELRADVFNVLNSTRVSGFAHGIPGGGPRTQVGRPGDAVTWTAAAPPRQIQLSARWSPR